MADLGTWIYTKLFGEHVGDDAFGNRYYRNPRAHRYGREKRWVMFKGRVEASKVPPEWHAWLHHISVAPLTEEAAKARPWQKIHLPNLSGTPFAYFPRGYDLRGGQRAASGSDYEPWTPS